MKPMLACNANPAKLRFPLAAQEKLDGIRVVIVDGKALTRSLKEIPNREVFDALSRPEFEGLDGEIIVGSPTALDAYRKTASFVMAPNKTGEPWCFHVFDKWDENPFGFEDRWAIAQLIVASHSNFTRPMLMVNYLICDDAEQLERYEAQTVAQGHEGVILRDPHGFYKLGRSSATGGELLKLKRFIDFEAEVVGVYEEQHNANEAVTNALGRTERSTKAEGKIGKGTLGGLVLRALNGPAEGVEFRCGTGFSADYREAFWYAQRRYEEVGQHKAALLGIEPIVGRVAKIKSFPIGAKDKPRFPVFLGWRHEDDR